MHQNDIFQSSRKQNGGAVSTQSETAPLYALSPFRIGTYNSEAI